MVAEIVIPGVTEHRHYASLDAKEGVDFVTESASLQTFDSIMKEVPAIYFLKMDIDGHEMKAGDGMRDTNKPRKIKHMEFDPFLWKEAGGHDETYGIKVAKTILAAGYHLYTPPGPEL